jgi:hypothetical protein
MKNRLSVPHNALTAIVLIALFALPALSHHSFAMYDQTKTVTWTGVVTGFSGQATTPKSNSLRSGRMESR